MGICLQPKYKLHIKNCIILDFFELMIRVKNIEALLSESNKEEFRAGFRKWGNRPPFLERKREVSIVEQGSKTRKIPVKIPLKKNLIYSLVKAWIEDEGIKLRPIERQSTLKEKRDPRYCLYHWKVGHSTLDYFTARKIYHNKVQTREIIQAAEKQPITKPQVKPNLHCN